MENQTEQQDEKQERKTLHFKIFDMYETEGIEIKDPGLKNVINLKSKLILKSHGKNFQKFGATKVNLVERLINRIGVSGHRGKKHRIMVGASSGKYIQNAKIVLDALKIIQEKTKKNPVEVLVAAVENSAPRDEVTTIEYGGARYPQAVDVSPLRRVNIAIKNIVHGASDRAFGKKKTITEGLADEIILASEKNGESFAIKKKIESEKQADSAR